MDIQFPGSMVDASIKIKGKHYFGCDYIFSNIYGSAVFNEDDKAISENEIPTEKITADPEKGEFSPETLEEFIKSDNDIFDISSIPACTKEIEYTVAGTLEPDGNGGVIIRYNGDFSPICMYVFGNSLHLSGQQDDFCELMFEDGKRNYVALPESLFEDFPSEQNENQSPLLLCLDTQCVENNITQNGGTLHVSYSIEVNGILAEVTDFVLTAIC